MTDNDLEILILLPYTTPEFEARLWEAVLDQPRDWDETEKKYLAANQGIRESIIDWCRFMDQSSCTDANLEFLASYREANAEDLTRPGADSDPRFT